MPIATELCPNGSSQNRLWVPVTLTVSVAMSIAGYLRNEDFPLLRMTLLRTWAASLSPASRLFGLSRSQRVLTTSKATVMRIHVDPRAKSVYSSNPTSSWRSPRPSPPTMKHQTLSIGALIHLRRVQGHHAPDRAAVAPRSRKKYGRKSINRGTTAKKGKEILKEAQRTGSIKVDQRPHIRNGEGHLSRRPSRHSNNNVASGSLYRLRQSSTRAIIHLRNRNSLTCALTLAIPRASVLACHFLLTSLLTLRKPHRRLQLNTANGLLRHFSSA